jgi:hypothetical protein
LIDFGATDQSKRGDKLPVKSFASELLDGEMICYVILNMYFMYLC